MPTARIVSKALKLQIKALLVEAGVWKDAIQYRENTKKALLNQGIDLVSAGREGWRQMLERYGHIIDPGGKVQGEREKVLKTVDSGNVPIAPATTKALKPPPPPKSPPLPKTVSVKAERVKEESEKIKEAPVPRRVVSRETPWGLSKAEYIAVLEEVKAKGKDGDLRADIMWVYSTKAYPIEAIDLRTAPSTGAIALLESSLGLVGGQEFLKNIWAKIIPMKAELDAIAKLFDTGEGLEETIAEVALLAMKAKEDGANG